MLELAICLVIAITDGDTLKVRCGSEGRYEQITVRLAGIDAPEKKQPHAGAFGQCRCRGYRLGGGAGAQGGNRGGYGGFAAGPACPSDESAYWYVAED